MPRPRVALDHAVGGQAVLIGNADMRARSLVDVPGRIDVPSSLIQIYAAETLKSGLARQIGGFVVLAFCALALCLSLAAPMRRWSSFAFALLAIGLPVFAVVAAQLGVRVAIAPSVVFLAIYSLLVAKTNWRNRLKLVDPATNLPTFAALEADRAVASAHPTIVVGKIHRLEEIKSSLPDHLHREYIDRIVERLRLKAGEETFYIGHGHYLAWSVPQQDVALIRDHLEGLRALLSAPLAVGGELVDVGMTFAVNTSASPNVAKRLAAAVAAVEQTSEADNPIATEARSEEDLRWNISLQARIDAALASGEIYLVYQPKVVLGTGEVVGLEALVRWDDPEKGRSRLTCSSASARARAACSPDALRASRGAVRGTRLLDLAAGAADGGQHLLDAAAGSRDRDGGHRSARGDRVRPGAAYARGDRDLPHRQPGDRAPHPHRARGARSQAVDGRLRRRRGELRGAAATAVRRDQDRPAVCVQRCRRRQGARDRQARAPARQGAARSRWLPKG